MTAADHTPTEPPFSDRLLLLRQEQGFVILPNLPFTTLRQLLQHSTQHPLHLTEHHTDASYADPPRTFENVPFHPMLSPEWTLPPNDEDGHTTRAQLEKRVRWTTQASNRDRLAIDITETENFATTVGSSQIHTRKHRRIFVGNDESDQELSA